jgi:hypothetical protein
MDTASTLREGKVKSRKWILELQDGHVINSASENLALAL